MRPIYLCDLDTCARVLLPLPDVERPERAAYLVAAARAGDKYRKKLDRSHPVLGNGTLYSAAQAFAREPARACDQSYLACLRVMLDALAHHNA